MSYWRELEEPCRVGKAIMMIFTTCDNECQGNPSLGAHTDTQIKTQDAPHALSVPYQSGQSVRMEIRGAYIFWSRAAKLVAPLKVYDDTSPPPPPLPLLTALSVYHPGNQTDSATLQPAAH